ncbi:casein kinase II subunit beta, putative [Entamoeba invadens IP1]|uniref:Casein kinase II subunit beta n=1 Tax=Entamoeba invadens IP1 TaxID=370355 RepID=A0A0A1U1C2_ENTIV|nr:casein kinase II subunit beta, putative [Entamoeba invadens IP1]ELP87844.1 casein kinase II subunit beta, putative [Entamoeba invadens IP1]|eukprot:XP_004254615.1 casein kinase II subunit beta, putative [Entamoeba invadens IP1]
MNQPQQDSETEPGGCSMPWITRFCSMPGHEYFVEVDEDYIGDQFNTYGLERCVPHFSKALDYILDCSDDCSHSRVSQEDLQQSAETLYGLVHARYILTLDGMKKMRVKVNQQAFGCCQRVKCDEQPLLPVGLYDTVGQETVKCFCPKCKDLYIPMDPHESKIDGSFIGMSFPHLYMLQYPDVVLDSDSSDSYDDSNSDVFCPTIYGFKIGKKRANKVEKIVPRKFVCF